MSRTTTAAALSPSSPRLPKRGWAAALLAAAPSTIGTTRVTSLRAGRLGRVHLDFHPAFLRCVRLVRIVGRPVPPEPGRRELVRLKGRELAHQCFLHGVRAI